MKKVLGIAALGAAIMAPTMALADTIDPASYSDTLAVGESVTIRKTVVIEETTSTALLDVMFVFDVTGSMGGEIAAAKSKAGDILTSLGGFGDLASGTGWYSDPGFDGVHTDLSTTDADTVAGIGDMWDTGSCVVAGTGVGCGGDFPEKGYAAIADAAASASWRPGSKRIIIAFGDASFKAPPTEAATIAALAAADVELLGVSFSGAFSTDIVGLGGTAFAATATGDSIATAIKDGVTASFEEYTEVTVDDLGAGMPGIEVDVVCVSADTGACVGDSAVGTYDRSVDRTFEYDVTFTAKEAGTHLFGTHALVDGSIVATERDAFKVPSKVSEPATFGLIGLGLAGIGFARRKQAA